MSDCWWDWKRCSRFFCTDAHNLFMRIMDCFYHVHHSKDSNRLNCDLRRNSYSWHCALQYLLQRIMTLSQVYRREHIRKTLIGKSASIAYHIVNIKTQYSWKSRGVLSTPKSKLLLQWEKQITVPNTHEESLNEQIQGCCMCIPMVFHNRMRNTTPLA